MLTETEIKQQLTAILSDITEKMLLTSGGLFVLGCSTSEIAGGHIGENSKQEIGTAVVTTLKEFFTPRGIALAIQGCEHLNRALVMEKAEAKKRGYEEVMVVPQLHAGGACSVAAFQLFKDPIEVEFVSADAGIDLGDTAIGMHVRHVQVPVRPKQKELGGAHITALYARPKYIGGPRAHYA